MQSALKRSQAKALAELDTAVVAGDEDVANALLQRGLPLGTADHNRRTPLVRAHLPA